MPSIENFMPKKKLFKSLEQIGDIGNTQNMNFVIESLTSINEDKLRTKLGQTQDKASTEPKTKLGQTQDKASTEPKTKLGQIQKENRVEDLTGLQLKIALFLFNSCKINGKRSTGAIYIQSVMDNCKTSKFSAQKSIQRLEIKKIIVRKTFKNGRGGWTNYEIPENIFHEMLSLESTILVKQNLGQTKDNTICSSSSDINKTTNYLNSDTIEPQFTFNLECLAHIGFTHNHVSQILKLGKLTPEQIQESIEHFAFDLEHNDRAKTFKSSSVDVFMGILRKGTYYNAPSNYESQKARNFRLSLEAKMKREQIEKKLENELKETEWKVWSESLTDTALMEFYIEDRSIDESIPDKVQKTLKRRNALNNARQHFNDGIWPIKRNKILNEHH